MSQEIRDPFGPIVTGRHGSGVRRPGRARTVLHIRPEPARGGSAESCGNSPTLNAVEILPCAERAPLHMGARTLKTDVPGRTPESCGNPRIGPRKRRPRMYNAPRTAREDPDPPESAPPPRPRREPGPARIPQEATPTTPIPDPVSPSLARKAHS